MRLIFMVMMPMTCPYSLMRGPPELPLFTAALVWIMVSVLPSSSICRSRPEIMPLVKVARSFRFSGLPMAYAVSPTLQ